MYNNGTIVETCTNLWPGFPSESKLEQNEPSDIWIMGSWMLNEVDQYVQHISCDDHTYILLCVYRADSMFAASQWETS